MIRKISPKKAAVTLILFFVAFFVFWQGYKVIMSHISENKEKIDQENEKVSERSEEFPKQENPLEDQENEMTEHNKSKSSELAPPLSEDKLQDTGKNEGKEIGEDSFINISPTDCTRECEPYKYYEDELEYCRQACGIIPPDIETDEDCDDLEDLEKDYCLKNSAIVDRDANICEKITDYNIRESCKKRIMEEILEEAGFSS